MKINGFKIGFKVVTFPPGRPANITVHWSDTSARTLRAAKLQCRKQMSGNIRDAILMIGVIDEYNLGPFVVSVAGNKPGSSWSDYEGTKVYDMIV